MFQSNKDRWEVAVIGGSVAGLTAAMALGRARRRTLILDGGLPANRFTPHSHGLFTRDGTSPAELLRIAREQALAYSTVRLQHGTVRAAEVQPGGFRLQLNEESSPVEARTLLLATGVTDVLPPWPGLAETWGKTVVHCPYCHGYELPAGPLGVVGNGEAGFELARLVHQWNPALRIFTNGPVTIPAGLLGRLAARDIAVIDTPIIALDHLGGRLRGVRLADASTVGLAGLYLRPLTVLPPLAAQLGCALTETGLVQADEMGLTSVPGVAAAGDCITPLRSLNMAAAAGFKAAAALNHALIAEDF